MVDVVPVAWTHVLGVVTHNEVDCSVTTPQPWREFIHEYLDHTPPANLGDSNGAAVFASWDSGFNPDDEVDRAIRATRNAVMPHFGVDLSYEI